MDASTALGKDFPATYLVFLLVFTYVVQTTPCMELNRLKAKTFSFRNLSWYKKLFFSYDAICITKAHAY